MLGLLRTKDPRRLFWKQRTSCTEEMPYHQMAPILSSALKACQLSKSKVSCRAAATSCMCAGAAGEHIRAEQ